MAPIYLDYNATTPIDREVAGAMAPFLYEHFGNPSSGHAYGAAAKRAVEEARGQVAALLGCRPSEVTFTSGGTESNNAALRGVARARRHQGRHLVTSAVEHPAVTEVCRALAEESYRITVLPVDGTGRVDPEELERALTPETVLVSVMHANNEVGTIQPIARLAEIAHRHGALFHTDAAQSVGKIPVDVGALGVDLLSLAGHKLYAPKGIGALYAREGVELAPLLSGAGQEGGRRPGTENVLEIVGLGRACQVAGRELVREGERLRALRDRLWEGFLEELGEGAVHLNGHPEERLPNTLSVSFRGVDATTLLAEIGEEVAASAGAACHADRVDVSEVLEAMRVPVEWAMGTVRLSLGRLTTAEEVERAVAVMSRAVERLRPRGEAVAVPGPAAAGEVRLTRFTHGMGCACKLRPQALEAVLAKLPLPSDPNVLVGAAGSDDAAVYRLSDELALVQTVDFFTPIVDDPYWFGAISAANSLSDVYAMGGRPIFALNVVGFPERRLPLEVLERILQGAQDKAAEAGISILGGHTVEDTEPKFGLAVTGLVHPRRILTNAGARPGDVLVLTKPLGTGIVSTAVKQGLAGEAAAEEARELMASLNREAAEAMVVAGAHAATDVTGFGLLGHARELAAASGVDLVLHAAAVPDLAAARELAEAGVAPGGTLANLEHAEAFTTFAPGVSRTDRLLLADAQTSGGLLISLPEERSEALLADLTKRGVPGAARIGRVTGPGNGRIRVEA